MRSRCVVKEWYAWSARRLLNISTGFIRLIDKVDTQRLQGWINAQISQHFGEIPPMYGFRRSWVSYRISSLEISAILLSRNWYETAMGKSSQLAHRRFQSALNRALISSSVSSPLSDCSSIRIASATAASHSLGFIFFRFFFCFRRL